MIFPSEVRAGSLTAAYSISLVIWAQEIYLVFVVDGGCKFTKFP